MKNIMLIDLLIFVTVSCNKKKPITPENYVGAWIAETHEILQTKYRIHTLFLPNEGKGTYTSIGNYKLYDQDHKGHP
jgi:hypothetical protein